MKINIFLLFLIIHTLMMSQTSLKTVVAVKGDGIYSILRKNGMNPITFYQQFIDLNKKNLNSDNGLFTGRTYIIPANNKIKTIKMDSITKESLITIPLDSSKTTVILNKNIHPFFGKGIKSLPLDNKKLEGAVYYLISGHGGPDPGAIGIYNKKQVSEDEYAYDVTLRLAAMLLSSGAKVYVIIKDPNDGIRDQSILKIDYDEVNYPNKEIPRNQKMRLQLRTQTVNDLYTKHKNVAYQRLLVIHVDSRSKDNNIDVFFYHHKNSKNGKRLAENIHQSFKQKYAKFQPNRKYSGTIGYRNLYLIENTFQPIVYIELGNIHNKRDQKRIMNYKNRNALAKWIAGGLLTDFNSFNKKLTNK